MDTTSLWQSVLSIVFVNIAEWIADKKAYPVKVNQLDIDPYPISRNKNTTFEISATTGNFFFYMP